MVRIKESNVSKEKLTFQIHLLLNKFVHIFFDSHLQLSVISLQLSVVPKEILVQPCPSVVAVRWKKEVTAFEVMKYLKLHIKASARTGSTRISVTSI